MLVLRKNNWNKQTRRVSKILVEILYSSFMYHEVIECSKLEVGDINCQTYYC